MRSVQAGQQCRIAASGCRVDGQRLLGSKAILLTRIGDLGGSDQRQGGAGAGHQLTFGMKAVLTWDGRGMADRAETLKFSQALHLGRGDSIKLGWQRERGRGAAQRTLALDYMHVF